MLKLFLKNNSSIKHDEHHPTFANAPVATSLSNPPFPCKVWQTSHDFVPDEAPNASQGWLGLGDLHQSKLQNLMFIFRYLLDPFGHWLGALASWNGGWIPWFPICSSQLLEHVSDSSALLELISAQTAAALQNAMGKGWIWFMLLPIIAALLNSVSAAGHVVGTFFAVVRVLGGHIMSC